MNNYKKAGVVGGIIVLADMVYNSYLAVEISAGFTVSDLLSELVIVAISTFVLIAPAIILLFKKFNSESSWVVWLYPLIVGLGLLGVYTATDPLAAGLPMILLVFPFCMVASVYFFLRK